MIEKNAIKGFLRIYQQWAKSLCSPVFWKDKEQKLHNGTMTFVQTQSNIIGITNIHVAEGIDGFTDEIEEPCRIGGAYLERSYLMSRLISRHPTLDLVTFGLSEVILAKTGHSATNVIAQTPPSENDAVALGGYPSIFHEEYENENRIDFQFAWFAGKVASVSTNNLGMVLNIATSESISSEKIAPNEDLGGMSGGPVFSVVENYGIERLELAAIIYEYSPTSEILLAHPIKGLTDSGNFIE